MKSYYHAHETAYQEIKTKGGIGWGGAKTLSELGDEVTNQYLKSIVPRYFADTKGKKALDLGCGSGTTAFTLSKLGFTVSGIDISETAIAMAKNLSTQQDLKINFIDGDILQLEKINEKFDVIYDSHCLHCIVFDEDRTKVLAEVKKSLAPKGIFILDTMVANKDFDPAGGAETLRFDENYILWHKTNKDNYRGIVSVDGQYWCAQRRIYPAEKVMQEVESAGFRILSNQTDIYAETSSAMLRLILG
jgi:2-polyprenyl-3-methyl-5-hydroxy-6-metoxy-1,4-benzoquinol methylase